MEKSLTTDTPLTVKQLINSFNWNNSPLGTPETWPKNLCTILSLILNTSLPMVIYWGKDNIALYNDAYADLIGSKHPALLGRPLIDIWPERKSHFNQIVSSIYQKETIKYTTNYQIPGTTKSECAPTQIEVTFSPILDNINQVQGMISIITKSQPETTTSTQTIEQLIGGLAHDFNTLLAGIIGNLELMQIRIEQNKINTLPRYIEAAQKAATQATEITHQLLAFSRRQTLTPHVIDPNHIIQALLDTFKNFIKDDHIQQNITIELQLEPNIWSIFCDPEQLRSAILHIFKNGCEAIHSLNGKILVKTENITVTSNHPLRKFIKPDDYVAIIIQDNGEGMSTEIINRATDPFFTTKPLGKRAGLGLSMAYGFTKQSNGHLHITSTPKTETIVSLFLPRYHRPLVIQKLHHASTKITFLKTLLISQDNHLCMLLSENLENLGYSMTIAQNEKEIWTLLKTDNDFSFIAIDTRLLKKTDFLETIKLQYPNLPLLFITGYEDTPITLNKTLIDEQNFVIRKPITQTMLANYIQTIKNSK